MTQHRRELRRVGSALRLTQPTCWRQPQKNVRLPLTPDPLPVKRRGEGEFAWWLIPGTPGVCYGALASEMRCAAVLEPPLSTGAGGRSPIVSSGWWTDPPSADAGPGCGEVSSGPSWLVGHDRPSASGGPDATEQGVLLRLCRQCGRQVSGRNARTPCSSYSLIAKPRAESRCEVIRVCHGEAAIAATPTPYPSPRHGEAMAHGCPVQHSAKSS